MPSKFTVDRAKVLAILADDEGHANNDLCKRLGKNDLGNMSRFLKAMQEDGLIHKGSSRPTSNPRSKRPGSPEQPFYIDKNDDFYSSFVDYVVKEDLKDDLAIFLRSNHMNGIIAEKGFIFAYGLIKKHLLQNPEIKSIASRELLSLSETAKYYEIYDTLGVRTGQVDGKFKELFEPASFDPSVSDNQGFKEEFKFLYCYDDSEPLSAVFPNDKGIKILGEFDFMFSVEFYRKNIFRFFKNYYKRLEEKGEISSGFREFMELDSYLSPLTSYPVNNSLYLIFIPPFQRIYDDVFLLEKEDVAHFILRAQIIYNNFQDILLERNKNLILDHDILELEAKAFTYHWNVAITRFDLICDYVHYFYETKGFKKFHLTSEGNRFYIIDLETNKQVLPLLAESDTLLYGLLPTDEDSPEKSSCSKLMGDPFGYLRPSKYFLKAIKDSAKERTADRLSSILIANYKDYWRSGESPLKP
jgi:hypothetical protein